MIHIEPTGAPCGAVVTGIDLTQPLDADSLTRLRRAWLEHHVLIYPDQSLEPPQFEAFVEQFGPIADDPYIKPLPGQKRIAAIQRRADETGAIFADVWHADWSFKEVPPSGTFLYGITIPPQGGDTLFCNEQMAAAAMPDELRARVRDLVGIHSARKAYSRTGGKYADYKGSMQVATSDDADAEVTHDILRQHPESGAEGLFAGSYLLDVIGLSEDAAAEIIAEVNAWVQRPEFVYAHKWAPDMLVQWDNRAVLHKATGGFEGYDRLLHRLTIEDDPRYHVSAA
ncbi:MAG: TauD/TfdA family dioxygenase [Marinibacterium sp.]|nr:TauD/TfdA family dioxygenase [Marinibacterium sp.]